MSKGLRNVSNGNLGRHIFLLLPIIRLNHNLDKALEAKLKYYYKGKALKYQIQEKEGHLFSKISELKARIAELENDLEVLQERIQGFLEMPCVRTFQKGRYVDEVRAAYEDLLCWGVGVENVENVVRAVLENLGGLQCGRVPKATFARCMYLEARRLAQIQVAEGLLDGWESGN